MSEDKPDNVDPKLEEKAKKDPKAMTDEEWRQVLSPQQFEVARNHGTERAFTGKLTDNKESGKTAFLCAKFTRYSSI